VTICAILTVFGPQFLAAVVVLSQHWNDVPICDAEHSNKWKYWAALSAIRMLAYLVVVVIMHTYKSFFEERPQQFQQINSIRNVVDALGLIWFVVGNMWIFAEDDTFGCRHPDRSPIYGLCVAMLIINYVQICLPCIAAIIVIPIFCFCMPCLIQVLARLHNPRAQRGAPESVIDSLPVVIIGAPGEHEGVGAAEEPCPICLKEMTAGEEARLLRCKHLFHKEVSGVPRPGPGTPNKYTQPLSTSTHTNSLPPSLPPLSAWTRGCTSTPRAPRAERKSSTMATAGTAAAVAVAVEEAAAGAA